MARRTKRTFKRKRSYKRKPRVSKKVKTYVKREVARQIQNKKTNRELSEVQYSTLLDSSLVYTLLPSISQGDGQGDRTGTGVRLKKAMLRMQCASTNGLVSSHWVDVYIFKMKSGIAPPTASQMVKFLENGNTALGYQGRVLDGLRPVNSDIFTLKYKLRRQLASNYAGNPGTPINNTPQCFTLKKDITKYFHKIWKYDDVAIAPTNDNLFIGVCATDPQGQVLQIFGEFTLCVDFTYEDA